MKRPEQPEFEIGTVEDFKQQAAYHRASARSITRVFGALSAGTGASGALACESVVIGSPLLTVVTLGATAVVGLAAKDAYKSIDQDYQEAARQQAMADRLAQHEQET